jgi:WW domain-binding protein 4
VASSSQKPRKSGGISDYSTPESLGYTDPDIERARAEAERRRTQGVAGDWQLVEPTPTEPPSGTEEKSTQHEKDAQDPDGSQETSKKRAVPDPAEEEGRWKLRKKTTVVGLGEIYDPGIIAIKPKVKAEETTSEKTQASAGSSVAGDANRNATALPKWAPVKWNKAGDPADDTSGEAISAPAGSDTSPTEGTPQVLPDPRDAQENPEPDSVADAPVKEPSPVKLEDAVVPSEEASSSTGSLFRKRKAPIGGGVSGRGRRY